MKHGGMKKGFKYPDNIKQMWITNGENNINVKYDINKGYEIPEGYTVGRTVKSTTTKGRKWYNNGLINGLFIEGEEPSGFKLGMLCDRTGKNNPNYKGSYEKLQQEKYIYNIKKQTLKLKWYNNGIINKVCFEGEQPEGFLLGQLESTKLNKKGKNTWSKGTKQSLEVIQKRKDSMSNRTLEQKMKSKQKEFNTKLNNGSLGNTVSKQELKCYNFLKNKFPNFTIYNQYFDIKRYPFKCDIYIDDLDIFIELNFFFTHGNHMPSSLDEAHEIDFHMPRGWNGSATSDYNKHQTAIKNELNYLYFYSENDFYTFFNNCSFNKITSIKIEDKKEYVYDIGVKDNDNMTLSNGLIVHNCKPYQYLKSTIYEKRFAMYRSNRLLDEFIDIQRNMDTGKIDHGPNFHKDALDAVCGATFTASKHAEEFAYDYGESLEQILEVNTNKEHSNLKQLTLDFEQELQKLGPQLHTDYQDSNEPRSFYLYDSDILMW